MSDRGRTIIYVVSSVNHGEQEGVVAVFSTHDKAREYIEHGPKTGGSTLYVRAWELDAGDEDRKNWNPGLVG